MICYIANAVDVQEHAQMTRRFGNTAIALLDQSIPHAERERIPCEQRLVKGLKNRVAQTNTVESNTVQSALLF